MTYYHDSIPFLDAAYNLNQLSMLIHAKTTKFGSFEIVVSEVFNYMTSSMDVTAIVISPLQPTSMDLNNANINYMTSFSARVSQ